jgi:AcrR family transcriptional regulator
VPGAFVTTAVRPNQREHILDAALELMSERGAAGMSMRQLAAACDLQVAAIYHYFPSKDALLAAVVAERQYGARLADPLPIDATAPPAERLSEMFVHVVEGAMSEQSIWKLLIGEAMRGEDAVLGVGRDLLALLLPAAKYWIEQAVPEHADRAELAPLMVGQMINAFITSVFEPDTDPAVIAAECARPLKALVAD